MSFSFVTSLTKFFDMTNNDSASENVLIPENLTLHEVVFTIRHVGGIIRRIRPNKHIECVANIRSLLGEIIKECEYLQPQQELCAPLKIITPCLWYWATANDENIFSIQKFHNIYSNEGWLLIFFLENSSPFVIPSCESYNNLLQTLENYYKTVAPHFFVNDKKLHYKIPDEVLQYRKCTTPATNDQTIINLNKTEEWLYTNESKLVEVPESPSTWIGEDPVERPILFDAAIKKILSSLDKKTVMDPKRNYPNHTNPTYTPTFTHNRSTSMNSHDSSTSIKSSSENDNRFLSIQSIHEEAAVAKVIYESPIILRWRDNIQNKITNVTIARNKGTNKLEVLEQELNPLLHCIAEVIVTENGVSIKK